METTDYVSYDVALALKKCGFDESCYSKWAVEPDGKPFLMGSCLAEFVSSECKGRDVLAPFIWQAQKWLREKKQLAIIVGMTRFDDWFYGIYDNCGKCLKDDGTQRYSYEQALSAGIMAAVELIKE